MTKKPSTSFFAAAVGHREMDGLYFASFAMPGEYPAWVTDPGGKPKLFRNAMEAELAAFRVLASKLNKSRDVQEFLVKRNSRTATRTFHAPERPQQHTVQSVFGNKK